MEQEVGLAHFVKGRLERVDQIGGELADEPDRVGKEERQIADDDLAHRGIESGKQFVLGKDLALGQQVHQSRLAHIGIANQSHTDETPPVLALGRFLLIYLGQATLEECHAVEDDATVHLKLGLTRTTQTNRAFSATGTRTAALPFKVCPQTLQTGQHVLVLRQLDLGLGIGRLGTHGKDVENERSTVQNFHFQFALNVAYLLGRKLVIEYHHADFVPCLFLVAYVTADFLQFALANISHRIRLLQLLSKPLHHHGTGCLGQEGQFVQIFVGLPFVLSLGDKPYQDGGLCLRFRNNKFFHCHSASFQEKAPRRGITGAEQRCTSSPYREEPVQIYKKITTTMGLSY